MNVFTIALLLGALGLACAGLGVLLWGMMCLRRQAMVEPRNLRR